MNGAQRSAIVLLLASAVSAYEQDAHADPKDVRPVTSVDPAMDANGPSVRRLLRAVLAWAWGREQRVEPDLPR